MDDPGVSVRAGNSTDMIFTIGTWPVIKSTVIGKIGAFCVASSPVILAVEMKNNHIDVLIAAIPPTLAVLVGVLALKKGQAKMFIVMDGRMSELLDATKRSSKSEGKEEERIEERARVIEDAPVAAAVIAAATVAAVAAAPTTVSKIEVVNTDENPVPTIPGKSKSAP